MSDTHGPRGMSPDRFAEQKRLLAALQRAMADADAKKSQWMRTGSMADWNAYDAAMKLCMSLHSRLDMTR